MNLYRLKISLLEPHYPINELHRIVEVRGDINFYELHQVIFDTFSRIDEHLWQFFVPRIKMDSFNKLLGCQEQIILPDNPLWNNNVDELTLYQPDISLDSLNLTEKEYLYYWFDFGENWVHRIRIEKVIECDDNTSKVKLIKSVGVLSAQGDEIVANETLADKTVKNDTDFEMGLIAALMLIASGGNGEPVRWQELVANGVADELVKRNLIKPCVSPSHIVRMTEFGESELVRVLQMTGILGK